MRKQMLLLLLGVIIGGGMLFGVNALASKKVTASVDTERLYTDLGKEYVIDYFEHSGEECYIVRGFSEGTSGLVWGDQNAVGISCVKKKNK